MRGKFNVIFYDFEPPPPLSMPNIGEGRGGWDDTNVHYQLGLGRGGERPPFTIIYRFTQGNDYFYAIKSQNPTRGAGSDNALDRLSLAQSTLDRFVK